MYKIRSQGFTLIELLVVIAIIGILSAVVLASLNTARTKGTDAAIASDLSTVQVQAEIYYGDTGGNKYNSNGTSGLAAGTCTALTNTLFADTTIWNAINGAIKANGGTAATVSKCAVANDGSSYAVSIQSKVTTSNYYCVDSTGYASPTGGSTKVATGGATAAAVCN
ncbi:hypothetical protein COU19_03170 [Candidatus Kaiserbacteria bacterium CG10_big_fil_rev_8_21_14_0_10_56_12]|uniref:Pili assembly chaperone n=1 Tax=Candidatus Kaiserbacteria bacterium CG10_big_fil_rev_8_21_14_0_10_56_12 TaxID=1974611 RepID=A0A2H0U920_9BACT|nr:MAG: hypothetical protein COU19_03170 [Candidatus Kaiserbacteria bacterium CG10_big_fil_rev_8_21_14_0_10_56_12]